MVEIEKAEDLQVWLADKPEDWAHVLSLRAAMRSLPAIVLADVKDIDLFSELSLAVFRALFMSWVAHKRSSRGAAEAADAVAKARRAVKSASPLFHKAASHAAGIGAADNAVQAASYAARTALLNADVIASAVDTAKYAAQTAMFAAEAASGEKAVWDSLEADANQLHIRQDPFEQPLWTRAAPDWFSRRWDSLANRLTNLNEDWPVWLGWFQRRIDGSNGAFGLPRWADEAITLRLTHQGEGFWGWPKDTNSTIAWWIREGRLDFEQLEPEPQNAIAVTFTINERGQIDIDSRAGGDQLATDAEATERHAELRSALVRAIEACGGNAGAAVREQLLRYGEVLGERIEDVRPSLLILRGEALRQELAIREKDDGYTNLAPIPDTSLLLVKEVVSGHNLFVGLDRMLARRDVALLSPDAIRPLIRPADVSRIVDRETRSGVLTEDARDALDTAARNAPAAPDLADRRWRSLAEAARNMVRKAFGAVWQHRKSAAAATAMPVVLYQIGGFLLRNEHMWLEWFAGNPSMLAVMRSIIDFLKTLPLA